MHGDKHRFGILARVANAAELVCGRHRECVRTAGGKYPGQYDESRTVDAGSERVSFVRHLDIAANLTTKVVQSDARYVYWVRVSLTQHFSCNLSLLVPLLQVSMCGVSSVSKPGRPRRACLFVCAETLWGLYLIPLEVETRRGAIAAPVVHRGRRACVQNKSRGRVILPEYCLQEEHTSIRKNDRNTRFTGTN